MLELRNKPVEGTECPKCRVLNSKFVKCMCKLKVPIAFPCERKDKFALYWCYTLLIWWKSDENEARCSSEAYNEQRREDIEVIADIDIEHNPFIHSVTTPQGTYYNLARAEKIQIMGPHWCKIHKTKHGNPTDDNCSCDDDCGLVEPEDFKEEKK